MTPGPWRVVEGVPPLRIGRAGAVWWVIRRNPDVLVNAKNAWLTEAAAQAIAHALNQLEAADNPILVIERKGR